MADLANTVDLVDSIHFELEHIVEVVDREYILMMVVFFVHLYFDNILAEED